MARWTKNEEGEMKGKGRESKQGGARGQVGKDKTSLFSNIRNC